MLRVASFLFHETKFCEPARVVRLNSGNLKLMPPLRLTGGDEHFSNVLLTDETNPPKTQTKTGSKRCKVEGCTKAARGATDKCIGHGGGKRCVSKNCPKSAVGSTDLCVKHGGGRRCVIHLCSKSARGGSAHCAKHGSAESKKRARELSTVTLGPMHNGFPIVLNPLNTSVGALMQQNMLLHQALFQNQILQMNMNSFNYNKK